MKQLLGLLSLTLLFFSCCSQPRVIFDPTHPGVAQVSNDCYLLNFTEEEGGVIQNVYYENDLIIEKIEDTYPDSERNYRLTQARILDDGESLISSTFHKAPKLSMNRSYVILDDDRGIKLSWTVKNTGKSSISGKRTIRFLIKGSKIETSLQKSVLRIDLTSASGEELSLFLENSADYAENEYLLPYAQITDDGLILELRDTQNFQRSPKQRAHWWFTLRVEER